MYPPFIHTSKFTRSLHVNLNFQLLLCKENCRVHMATKERQKNSGLQSIYIFFISFDSLGDMLRNSEVGATSTSTFSSLLSLRLCFCSVPSFFLRSKSAPYGSISYTLKLPLRIMANRERRIAHASQCFSVTNNMNANYICCS